MPTVAVLAVAPAAPMIAVRTASPAGQDQQESAASKEPVQSRHGNRICIANRVSRAAPIQVQAARHP